MYILCNQISLGFFPSVIVALFKFMERVGLFTDRGFEICFERYIRGFEI